MKLRFNFTQVLLLISTFALFVSCGSSNTVMTGSWANESALADEKYESVFVVFIGENQQLKQQLEDNIAYQATLKGIKAIKGRDVFPPLFGSDIMPQKEELLKEIRASGAETIFTVAIRDKETTTRYVPGSTTYYPMSYMGYGRFYGYYTNYYPIGYDPGYYTENNIYYVESNLYDAETEELLWSAQSKTYNPVNFQSFVKGYTETLIEQLIKDGVLKS